MTAGQLSIRETWKDRLNGSIQMGLGYALFEQCVMDGGKTLNTDFADYKMPMAIDMPPSKVVHVDTYESEGPLGAKECRRGPCISYGACHFRRRLSRYGLPMQGLAHNPGEDSAAP